jgi:hypothetical protein
MLPDSTMKFLSQALFGLALASSAHAQSVQQSGVVTPGHIAEWLTNGVIGDGGAIGGGATLNGNFTINDFVCANATSSTPSLIDCGLSATGTNNWPGVQNFNGGATAPTRAAGDSTTNVATTAWVETLSAITAITTNTLTISEISGAGNPLLVLNNTAGTNGAGGGLLFNVNNSNAVNHTGAYINGGYIVATAGAEQGLIDFEVYEGATATNRILSETCVGTSCNFTPSTNNYWSLGITSLRWSNIYSVLGNFSGQINATALDLSTGTIFPSADSTTAIQITNAAASTVVVNVDTTNGRVGIGKTNPAVTFDVTGAGQFSSSVTASYVALSSNVIAPVLDSTTGVIVKNAALSTSILVVDTTNDRVGINKTPSVAFDVNGAVAASSTITGGGLVATADPGGTASANTLSSVSSTTISSGTGTVKMSSANSANNAAWVKIYAGTTAYWVPAWTTNAP